MKLDTRSLDYSSHWVLPPDRNCPTRGSTKGLLELLVTLVRIVVTVPVRGTDLARVQHKEY